MRDRFTKAVISVLALGAMGLTILPASAAPAGRDHAVGPLVLVASGGWAARASGHQGTYDPPFVNGGYGGYAGAERWDGYSQAYGRPRYRGNVDGGPDVYGDESSYGYGRY